jgi:hypothetical protein
MKVNIKKTKIMILQKHNSKLPNLNFHIGNKNIDIVKEYTYLGLKLVPNSKFKIVENNYAKKLCMHFIKFVEKLIFINSRQKQLLKFFTQLFPPFYHTTQKSGEHMKKMISTNGIIQEQRKFI